MGTVYSFHPRRAQPEKKLQSASRRQLTDRDGPTTSRVSYYHIGNVSRFSIATLSFDQSKDTCYGLVGQMRDALKTINSDYLSKMRDGDTHLNFLKQGAAKFMKGEVVSLNFTSLCRFPLYETDFGWGKPVWVGSASLPFKNLVVFMDTKSGGGIEAWVNLKEEDMAKFQEDEQLLACTYQAQDAKI